MDSFIASVQQRWPVARTDYHWHVLPDPALVREHLTLPYRDLLYRPGLAPVPAVWAHVTVEHFAPIAGVSYEEIAKVAELVRNRCEMLTPIELTIRRAEIWRNGVVCPVSPGEPLRRLWEITTAAGREVTGGRFGIQPSVYHPHLALAYAVNHLDDAPLRAWLSDHDVPEVSLPVSGLSLVAQQHDGRQITWRLVSTVPLGVRH